MSKISGQSGIVFLDAAATISGASGTTTITIDFTGVHGLIAKDRIYIADAVGMTDINGYHTVVSAPDTDTITILIDETAQTWSSGGTAQQIIDITGWSLEETAEAIDVTDSSNTTWKAFLASGFTSATGTVEGFLLTGANKPALGTSLTVKFDMDGSNYYSGSGIFTSDATVVNIPGTEAIQVTYNVQMTGTVTPTFA